MTRRRRQLLNTAEDHRDGRDLDNVAHFEPRRETVGELLRRTREIKGSDLDAVAARLRIRPGYLKAIEGGRFQDLPGSTYAVGFVRTYADHLGLDSEDVVRRFRDEVAEVNNQTQLIFPVVAAEGKIPRGAILLVSAVLGAIAYGGWYYLSERDQSPLDLIPELPGQLRELVSGEETTLPDAADPAPQPAVDSQSAADQAAAVPQSAGVPAPSPESSPAAVIPPAPTPEASASAGTAATSGPAPVPAVTPAPADTSAEAGAAAPVVPATPDAPSAAGDQAASPDSTEAGQSPAPAAAAPAAQIATVPQPSAPPPSVPAPAVPPPDATTPQAVPTFDSSGLPTVAAPPAPATGSIQGVTPSPDNSALPPVAEGQVFGATDAPSRIVLVARLESWVQVTDPDTNALLTRVLRAGDRYYVPDQAGLMLATGNAGGLDIWVDGRKLPALGPVGVVRRSIALDPQRLSDGTAASGTPVAE